MLHKPFRIFFRCFAKPLQTSKLNKSYIGSLQKPSPYRSQGFTQALQESVFRTTPTRFHVLTQSLQESILYMSQHKSRLKNPCQNQKTRNPILNYNVSNSETSYSMIGMFYSPYEYTYKSYTCMKFSTSSFVFQMKQPGLRIHTLNFF